MRAWPRLTFAALLHELQVHQIELEMQNEELQRARAVAEEASERYQDLFAFAPVGYFLWDVQGHILEVNLAGAALLGLDRSMVVHKRFGQFVAMEHRAMFADFCRRVLLADAKQTCEVEILNDGQAVAVLVEGIAVHDRRGHRRVCRAAVIDISQQKRAEEDLKRLNETLEQRVAERTKAIEMLHDIATMANIKFEEHLLTISDEIQQGIAQDLHDDVGQELTGLGLKAVTLAEMLATAETPAGKLAADIVAAVDRTHDKVRRLSRGILPIELEEGLLAVALEQLADATSASSRIRCEFTCSHPDPVFDSRISMHLYRIAQEAVANALRHSGAHRIRIALAQENGETTLGIEDDGTGLFERSRACRRHGPADHALSRGIDRWETGDRRPPGRRDVSRVPGGYPPPENTEIEK